MVQCFYSFSTLLIIGCKLITEVQDFFIRLPLYSRKLIVSMKVNVFVEDE